MANNAQRQWIDRAFPPAVRAFVRAHASGLVVIALALGAMSAVFDKTLNFVTQFMHEILFGLPHGAHLSVASGLQWQRVLLVLTLGGAALSLLAIWTANRFAGRLADAIEANALHGGRMSMGGSLYIVGQTIVSNGVGASVGLEAAYTQICSAVASYLGRGLATRRADARLLVGCGAAGAISAAFGAPLAGSFYGFEIALGAYTVASLTPIATSAIAASLVASALGGTAILDIAVAPSRDVLPTLGHSCVLAAICALLGILVMEGVAFVEWAMARAHIPQLTRPAIGGVLVAGLAMISPQVMGSGHGALQANQLQALPLATLAMIVALKCAGSAVSLGAGFRGGLFFASLLIGGTLGRLYAETINLWTPLNFDPGAAAVVGLASFGAGVLGAPMTMTALALEMTGDLHAAIAALVGAVLANFIVRETFGYSFATWRFHLRGESIRSAADIGWMRDMTVGGLMRKGAPTASMNITIGEARAQFPPASEKQFILLDGESRYAGVILTGDLYASDAAPESPLKALAPRRAEPLTPELGVRDALHAFEENECDVLAVVDTKESGHVVGLLTEAHALRRYGDELERRHRAVIER